MYRYCKKSTTQMVTRFSQKNGFFFVSHWNLYVFVYKLLRLPTPHTHIEITKKSALWKHSWSSRYIFCVWFNAGTKTLNPTKGNMVQHETLRYTEEAGSISMINHVKMHTLSIFQLLWAETEWCNIRFCWLFCVRESIDIAYRSIPPENTRKKLYQRKSLQGNLVVACI